MHHLSLDLNRTKPKIISISLKQKQLLLSNLQHTQEEAVITYCQVRHLRYSKIAVSVKKLNTRMN